MKLINITIEELYQLIEYNESKSEQMFQERNIKQSIYLERIDYLKDKKREYDSEN